MSATARRRPATVTLVVVLLYIAGISEIVFGILTIFARYGIDTSVAAGAASGIDEQLRVSIAVVGAVIVLFGLFVIALASGISRGSRFSRVAVAVVLGLGLALDAVSFALDSSGGGGGALAVQAMVFAVVCALLWLRPGSDYFAKA